MTWGKKFIFDCARQIWVENFLKKSFFAIEFLESFTHIIRLDDVLILKKHPYIK